MMDITKISFDELQRITSKIFDKDAFNYLMQKFKRNFATVPQGFPAPDTVIKGLIANIISPKIEKFADNPAMVVCGQLTKNPYPWYWLDKGLACDLSWTNCPSSIPDKIVLANLGIIVLPKGAIHSDSIGDFQFIAYNLSLPTSQKDCHWYDDKKYDKNMYHLSWFAVGQTADIISGTLGLKPIQGAYELFSDDLKQILALEEDNKELNQIRSLLLNCLVYCNPINTDTTEVITFKNRGFGKSKKKNKKYYKPLLIGKGHNRIVQDIIGLGELEEKGGKKSPHWRRGHWARRRHGSREDWHYEWHWIKPTIIGINEAA